MDLHIFPASERGLKDIGWLKSHFVFSFSDFYHPLKSAFGTLVAFNDDAVEKGKGFGIHPHLNMEIISVMLKGNMNHKDSLGYSTVVHEDAVQIMSAGTGLYHEEYNVGDTDVNFLQIWIQPKLANIRPRYQYRTFPKDQRRNSLKTIVSGEEGLEHCWINQNTKISLGLYDNDQTVTYTFPPVNKCLFVYILEGSLQLGGQTVNRRDGMGVWNTDRVELAVATGTEFIIIETPVNQK